MTSKKAFKISIIIHLVVFLYLLIQPTIYKKRKINHEKSIRVDVVGLPEKNKKITPKEKNKKEIKKDIKEKPKTEPIKTPKEKNKEKNKEKIKKEIKKDIKEKPKTEPKKVEKKVNKPKTPKITKKDLAASKKSLKDEQKNALSKLKNLDDKKADSTITTESTPVKGNKIADGSSLTGLTKLSFNDYLGKLDQAIKNHWSLPDWLDESNFQAIIIIKINKSGKVISKNFEKKSTNTIFNQQVVEAIEKANPLPPPPDKIQKILENDGIELRFPH